MEHPGPRQQGQGAAKRVGLNEGRSGNRLFSPPEDLEIVAGFDVPGRQADQVAEGLFRRFEIAAFLQEGVTQ
jgi:hypothetical protein